MTAHILWLNKCRLSDIEHVGGKNASLGEMIHGLSSAGVKVPGGFATTATAYREFLSLDGLDNKINAVLAALNVDDIVALQKAGRDIRQWIIDTPFPDTLESDIRAAYRELEKQTKQNVAVAVRSSATAEDLPSASFAGQQESYLNIRGIEQVLQAIKAVFASLFNDRAIAYRTHHGFAHNTVALSAGIQLMARSDIGASGVMFTMDTESGFNDVVFITASYGLGETVVQGAVNPDEFYVYKPTLLANCPAILKRNLGSKLIKMIYDDSSDDTKSVTTVDTQEKERQQFCLTDDDITQLARYAVMIEDHYKRPMDIEWAKDGETGELIILQARPETVKSRANTQALERYALKENGDVLVEGRSIGQKIGQGHAKVIKSVSEIHRVKSGDVLVTDMTDPDWEPVMKKASAIITNRGGRTCHAAIIARELGIPAIVGCGDATKRINDGEPVTANCADGDTGYVFKGKLNFEVRRIDINTIPDLPLKVMLNVGNPERAFTFQALPNAGVGLARLEFIISNTIGIHPKALLNFDTLPETLKKDISKKIAAYKTPVEYYVERLKEGIATIAAAFYSKPVIVRLSDFKSNEYANLLGGNLYEPSEENPMLGFRGASRYISPDFSDCFSLECEAVKRVRNEMGLTNVQIMIPFVRTLQEAKHTIELLEKNGLKRGENDLKVIMMCELPSNALLAEQFLEYFDGFSIGSNDLTQLTLGLDRDSNIIAHLFDERDSAVKALLHLAISACLKNKKYIGICGQGPSDHQDFAQWLMQEGIDSISLNPDSVVETCLFLAELNH